MGFEDADIGMLRIAINSKPVDALSTFVHNKKAKRKARVIVDNLKKSIPRQNFNVKIQAY